MHRLISRSHAEKFKSYFLMFHNFIPLRLGFKPEYSDYSTIKYEMRLRFFGLILKYT